MALVKEHVCTKHTNDVNGQLALRYEAKTRGCPLCAALEAEKPEGDWVEKSKLDECQSSLDSVKDDFDEANNTVERLVLEANDATQHAKAQVVALGEQLESMKKKDEFIKQQDEEITALKKAIAEGNDVKDLEGNN